MNNNEGSFNDEELRKRAASNEELNIRLTNNYAFQKIFKNEEIVKGFLMALLHLKETDIETLEVADPFVEGEVKEEKEGISQSTVSDWKIKKNNPSADKIMIICKALDISPYELLAGTEDMNNSRKYMDYAYVDKDSKEYTLIETYQELSDDAKLKLERYMEALRKSGE